MRKVLPAVGLSAGGSPDQPLDFPHAVRSEADTADSQHRLLPRDGGQTSEQWEDSSTPHAYALVDSSGRIVVLTTHNTDFGDAYEREADDPEFFYRFSVEGYAIGINILLYAMTH